ncbi:site-specific DNA-methyltransferase [Patescibacteria group bacterium]
MNLTENEKRDAIKLIQKGKPLPDKYRFLLFDQDREVELVWNGKTSEVTNTILPFQTIEHIDEPRSDEKIEMQGSLFDTSGRQQKGWTNKLIWGDNKLILSSLKNGPLRKEIEKQGGIKLIYIDPPFDVGADFSMDIEIGDEKLTKKPSQIEQVAYRDTWGKGADSFNAMIYERLKLMHDLLVEDGSIYVHCDWRVSGHMRLILDEIFGADNFRNEIIWKRSANISSISNIFRKAHDSIFYYSKSPNTKLNKTYKKHTTEYLAQYNKEDKLGRYRHAPLLVSGKRSGSTGSTWRGFNPNTFGRNGMHWITKIEKLEKLDAEERIYWPENGQPMLKYYFDETKGVPVSDIWDDIKLISPTSIESANYPTQKPETLMERIIQASTNTNDLIADFFCGSGSALTMAEKLGRKWVGSDLGRFSIHTTRKRMINVQRELKKESKDYRAFEILNIGRYERENYISVNNNLKPEEAEKVRRQKEKDFVNLMLSAYKAESVNDFTTFVGKKRDRLIAVGPINTPITSDFIDSIVAECKEKGITKADVLAFEFEMGIDFDEYKKDKGIDLAFRYIPNEVFDKKAVEKGQVKFHDVAYIEVKPIVKGRGKKKTLAIELVDFGVFYNQDADVDTDKLRPGGNKVVIDNGQVIKISKDKKNNLVDREVLTKKWSDWIDYWSVDFDYESKKEIIRSVDPKTKKEKEEWTGDYIFENEWQSFRTKKDRDLEFMSAAREVTPGKRKIAIKVVDIFGNDTTKVIEITV